MDLIYFVFWCIGKIIQKLGWFGFVIIIVVLALLGF